MNRRDFIKTTGAITAAGSFTSLGEEESTLTGSTPPPQLLRWDYVVYCYEREQGEWVFSKNIRGSFAPEREYMTFEEDCPQNGYLGFMYDGILHFQTFDDATDFVDMHVRTKDDANIIDSIYDVYRQSDDGGAEIQVAHYWFNGDTGSQIQWEDPSHKTDWNKVENG
jgi:hypothetical protein